MLTGDSDYGAFCGMVTAYRQMFVVMAAVDSGIIDAVAQAPCSTERLLELTGIGPSEGGRFLRLLVGSGILLERDGLLHLSPFSATYLASGSEKSQRGVLEFEKLLQERWQGLGNVLLHGQGSGVEEQPPEEYRHRLNLFQKAMHEAALIRSAELWDAIGSLPEEGVIIDAGAGDGTYLRSFLGRHPGWRGVACDLGDVLAGISGDGIEPRPCNLLDPDERRELVGAARGQGDILLLSNFIHCYGSGDVAAMLLDLGELVSPGGMLLIHDFFTDGNAFGALYDLHMMVNTLSGRTYGFAETEELLRRAGFAVSRTMALPSMSHALVAVRA